MHVGGRTTTSMCFFRDFGEGRGAIGHMTRILPWAIFNYLIQGHSFLALYYGSQFDRRL
jgi:hypothetical protein